MLGLIITYLLVVLVAVLLDLLEDSSSFSAVKWTSSWVPGSLQFIARIVLSFPIASFKRK